MTISDGLQTVVPPFPPFMGCVAHQVKKYDMKLKWITVILLFIVMLSLLQCGSFVICDDW